jgi:hypothetical protein
VGFCEYDNKLSDFIGRDILNWLINYCFSRIAQFWIKSLFSVVFNPSATAVLLWRISSVHEFSFLTSFANHGRWNMYPHFLFVHTEESILGTSPERLYLLLRDIK